MFQAISNTLLLAVGENAGVLTPGIEGLDLYAVDLQAGGPALTNLSLSNGLATPPFLVKSELTPELAAVVPGTTACVFFNDTGAGDGELLRLSDAQSGLQVVLPDVKDLEVLDLVNGDFLAVVRRSTGNQDRELWRVASSDGTATLVMSMPDTHTVERTAVRADGWYGFVQVAPVKERLWLVDPATLVAHKLPRPLFFGPTIGFAPTGELAFTVGTGGIAIKAVLPVAGAPQRIGLGTGPGFVLPGA